MVLQIARPARRLARCSLCTIGLGIVFIGCGPSTRTNPHAASSDGEVNVHSVETKLEPSEREIATDNSESIGEEIWERIDHMVEAGETEAAINALRQILIADPSDERALFSLANLEANQGNFDSAVELLEAIPEDNFEAGLPALGQAADWCFHVERYDDAENKYKRLIELAPDAIMAHRQLAYLLNRQGRRQEAAMHVRELCKLGDVLQQELQSLIILNDAMYDDPQALPMDASRPYWPIGASGVARRLMNEQRYGEAVQTLESSLTIGKERPATIALYGRAIVEAQDEEKFRHWLSATNASVQQFSDYWAALGTHLLMETRFEEAARALGEAIDRDPTDLISIARLRQALLALDQPSLAEHWQVRWRETREILRVNNRLTQSPTPNPDDIGEIAARLVTLGRNLEATLWRSIEASRRGLPQEVFTQLNEQRLSLVESDQAFPNRSQRLCEMDLSRYRISDAEISVVPESLQSPRDELRSLQPVQPKFSNISLDVGLEHSFSVAAEPQESGFAIYQILGAAVAVLDFDLDGAVDLYLGQGAADPPEFRGQQSNVLYRNVSQKYRNVTAASATTEMRYSTGMTAGDWNQDGFPDLAVSNIGGDVLLINHGDGSFHQVALLGDQKTSRVPTSVAMSDLTGDSLPDLFQVAYVDDPLMAQKPLRDESGGVIASLVPTDFVPAKDRLIANDGQGGQLEFEWDSKHQHTAAALGVVITNFDGEPGNEVFIGNDLYANQYWKRDPGSDQWSEVAMLLGCGFGYLGGATASMGIASGDFDGSQTLDLHITNYQNDAVSLFMSSAGMYRDRNLQYRLSADSRAVLGFGTQALDFDNDGFLDLAVTNGHVENVVNSSEPFLQPPQLFRNMSRFFELVEVSDDSGYWDAKHLGRAMAKLDYNRDGRMDLVVSHLQESTALLVNQTQTTNHWLQLQFVGTQSERDAIGASVQVTAGEHLSSHWVTAGDGYLARNEAIVSIGLGNVNRVHTISITWPSGTVQTLTDIAVDRRLLIAENHPHPFELK